MFTGITNFLKFVNENWTSIVVIISLIIAIIQKIRNFLAISNEEKISIAKAQIREIILKFVAEAEMDFEEWNKAGSIKRSQVIQKIFDEYPILKKVTNQKSLVHWIDVLINNSLVDLRKIVEVNDAKDTNESNSEN